MTLTPQHRAMLIDDSTIAEDVAEERGYCTLPHPQEILDRGFSSVQRTFAPFMEGVARTEPDFQRDPSKRENPPISSAG